MKNILVSKSDIFLIFNQNKNILKIIIILLVIILSIFTFTKLNKNNLDINNNQNLEIILVTFKNNTEKKDIDLLLNKYDIKFKDEEKYLYNKNTEIYNFYVPKEKVNYYREVLKKENIIENVSINIKLEPN